MPWSRNIDCISVHIYHAVFTDAPHSLIKCNILSLAVRVMLNCWMLILSIFPQRLKDKQIMSVTWQGEQNCYSLPTLNKPIILVLLRDCRLWEIVEDRSDSWSWSNPYSPPPSWDPLKTIPFQQWASQVLLCPHHQTAVLRSEAVLRCPLDIKHHEIKCGNEADYEDVWNAVPTCNIST